MKILISILFVFVLTQVGFGQEKMQKINPDSIYHPYTDSHGNKISIRVNAMPSELPYSLFEKGFTDSCNCSSYLNSDKTWNIHIWEIKKIRKNKKYKIRFSVIIIKENRNIEEILKTQGIANWEIKLKRLPNKELSIVGCKFLYGEI